MPRFRCGIQARIFAVPEVKSAPPLVLRLSGGTIHLLHLVKLKGLEAEFEAINLLGETFDRYRARRR